jgi:hypothetical protein
VQAEAVNRLIVLALGHLRMRRSSRTAWDKPAAMPQALVFGTFAYAIRDIGASHTAVADTCRQAPSAQMESG